MTVTSAFVLTRAERREADWLLTLYSEKFGLIRAVAPGARRAAAKLRGHLEPLTKTEIAIVHGKNGYRLTGAISSETYPRLRNSLERRSAAEKAAAVITRVFFEERDEKLWEALDQLFRAFNTEENLAEARATGGLYWFLTRVLAELGYRPSHDSLFHGTPRLRSLLCSYETESIAPAMTRDYTREASENVSRALKKAFQVHTGHDFMFLATI